jgi:hypothetical protein
MALVIKLKSSNIFWTGKEDAVWSDKLEDAFRFEELENAELEVEEKANKYGYFTDIVDESDVTVEVVEVVEEPATEE